MKKYGFLSLLLTAMILVGCSGAEILMGSYSNIKEAKEFNVEFDFSQWTFYDEGMSMQEYVEKRKKDITADKGAEEAKDWYEDWVETKKVKIPNNFLTFGVGTQNRLEENDMEISYKNTDADYTVIVVPTWTYPGWYGGIVHESAKLKANIKIVKSEDRDKVLLQLKMNTVQSESTMGIGIPNNNERIATSFTMLGDAFARLLPKQIEKAVKAANK